METLPRGYSGLVWPLLLADVDCWWLSPDLMDFLSGCVPSLWFLSIFLWLFLFLGGDGPTPLIFSPLCLLWAFLGTLAWRVLSVIWRASWAHYGLSLVCFLDPLLLQGDHLLREISMSSRTAWYMPSCLGQGSFLTLFVTFTLEGLIGLLKAIAEIGRLDLPAVGISFGR